MYYRAVQRASRSGVCVPHSSRRPEGHGQRLPRRLVRHYGILLSLESSGGFRFSKGLNRSAVLLGKVKAAQRRFVKIVSKGN